MSRAAVRGIFVCAFAFVSAALLFGGSAVAHAASYYVGTGGFDGVATQCAARRGIAVVSSTVWTPIIGSNTICVQNADGTKNYSSNYPISGNGLNSPVGIATVSNGGSTTVWVTNNGNNTISVFNTDGTASSMGPLSGNGLSSPWGVAVVNNGGTNYVWVVNNASNTISVFNSDGTASTTYSGNSLSGPTDLAVVGSQVWVMNVTGKSISRFNTDGTVATGTINIGGVYDGPKTLAVVGSQVWVGYYDDDIGVYDTDGTNTGTVYKTYNAGTYYYPFGITTVTNDAGTYVWVTSDAYAIDVLNTDGTQAANTCTSYSSPCLSFGYAASKASSSDTVVVQSGTYGPQNISAHGTVGNLITIEPENGGSVTLTRASPASNSLQATPLLDLGGSTYLRVTGFTIVGMKGRSDWNPAVYAGGSDGAGEVQESGGPANSYLTLDHLTIEHSTDNCIKAGGFATVTNNTIVDCGTYPSIHGHGIYISEPNETVTNNSIDGSAGEGIQAYDTGDATNNEVIKNNIITKVINVGILAWGGSNDTISGNFVYDNGRGIDLNGEGPQSGQTVTDNIIAQNTYNPYVQQYTASGTFVNNPIYGTEGSGGHGVAVVSNNVWITNADSDSISRFTTSGTTAGSDITGNGLDKPGQLTVAGSQVWVINGTSTISRFNFDGTSAGSPLSVSHASGIATVGNQVWVADSNDYQIYRFNFDGSSAGGTLTGNGLNFPTGIGVVTNGTTTQVWVGNENGGGSISLFNTDGTSAGSPITGNGVAYPESISMVGSQVWVSDNQSRLISRFNPDGTAIGSFSTTGNDPTQITTVNGNAWIGLGPQSSYGHGIYFSGAGSNIDISNNTLYNNAGTEITPYTGSSAFSIENNIFDDAGWTGSAAIGSIPTSSTIDYNDYYDVAAPASPGVHSITGDPEFTNPAGLEFTLLSSSPVINAGTDLGATYEHALASSSTWPGNVVTLNQNDFGAGWDIGAYVYTQTSTPTVALTSPSSGSTLADTVTVSADASAIAPASISSIQFLLDGSNLGSAVTSSPYAISWSTGSAGNGAHTLSALATDNYGNTATASSISLTVANPTISVGGSVLPPSFKVNDGAAVTRSSTVTLWFFTSPEVASFVITTNYGGESSTATRSYASTIPLNLCAGLSSCESGTYTVAVDFLNATGGSIASSSEAIDYLPAGIAVTPVASSTPPVATSTITGVPQNATVAQLQTILATLEAELQTLLKEAAARGIVIQGVPALATSSSQYVFTRDLALWDRGKGVNELQRYLVAQNSGPAAEALARHGTTDTFGPLTYAALKEFQKAVDVVPASGYFGPITRGYIKAHEE
jgi:Bacterial Ig domain/Right handed beta helix region